MSHDRHTESDYNQDCDVDALDIGQNLYLTRESARSHYLEMLEGFESKYPDPEVRIHENVRVVRDDLITGTKCRAAEPVVARSNHSRFVYCQPRTGLAGVSLIDVARKYDRDVTLFMPSSQRISHHQACCIERGADPVFERIAAMPNLNKYAREWAGERGHEFIPIGLKHPLATAGIVRAASTIDPPDIVFVAMSTGVLCRALQIAWPKARFYGVAVARNIQDGERGAAEIITEPLPFQTPEKDLPLFPTVPTYDGKAWKYCREYAREHPEDDVLFWNVGKDPELKDEGVFDRVDSYREWRKKPNLLELT